MATDRAVYLALDELARRYETSPAADGATELTRFELRCFSQHGEDGVIAEILRRIGTASRFFVEFGVESGREGNCVFLADVVGWGGLFLEADDAHYAALERKYAATERVRTVKAIVTPASVESLFAAAGAPPEPDVMSIDIDGADYWVWEAITSYRPRVVVIEYNAALPVGRPLVQPRDRTVPWDGTDYFGASLDALCMLAAHKGYQLVHTELAAINAFFVRDDLLGEAFGGAEEVVRRTEPNYFLQGYRHPHDELRRPYVDPRDGTNVALEATAMGAVAGERPGILGAMADSSGAGPPQNEQSSADLETDETATGADHHRAETVTGPSLRTAIEAPPPPPPPAAGDPSAGAPVPTALVGEVEQMRSHADLFGFAITAVHRFGGMVELKRLLRRLQYQVFSRQSEFNQAAVRTLEALVSDEHSARRGVDMQARALAKTELRIAGFETGLATLRAENTALRERLDRQQVALAEVSAAADLSGDLPALDYLSLQARFRGDEAEIAERQRHYLGYFADQQDVLDIGCGRGEFLGLLSEAGISASGVDTDLEMVRLCQAHGFEVSHDDALSHLSRADDGAYGGVFAAQVIEHLPPAHIVELMQLAHRKLRPGGVLVLETVNPGTLVALANFYLDFTHVKPVHPLALEWLAESLDFVDSELLYLSPVEGGPRLHKLPEAVASADEAEEFNQAVAATNEVLYGPRDFALIARRP